jgi:hypothetical protein
VVGLGAGYGVGYATGRVIARINSYSPGTVNTPTTTADGDLSTSGSGDTNASDHGGMYGSDGGYGSGDNHDPSVPGGSGMNGGAASERPQKFALESANYGAR